MKIIDLLNKIANREEVEFKIIDDQEGYYCKKDGVLRDRNNQEVEWWIDSEWLNNEVEIIEEEKKIPEKIKIKDYDKCIHNVTHKEKELSLDIRELQIRYNDLLDYLKSKGE